MDSAGRTPSRCGVSWDEHPTASGEPYCEPSSCPARSGRVPSDAEVELVLRKHLPVPLPHDTWSVLCICDMRQTYVGPAGHRLHVAAALREAGMLRD